MASLKEVRKGEGRGEEERERQGEKKQRSPLVLGRDPNATNAPKMDPIMADVPSATSSRLAETMYWCLEAYFLL